MSDSLPIYLIEVEASHLSNKIIHSIPHYIHTESLSKHQMPNNRGLFEVLHEKPNFCGWNAVLFFVKVGGTHGYHCEWKG